MVVGRPRARRTKIWKANSPPPVARASGWPLFVDGRRNSKVRKLNKVPIQLRIASHRIGRVESPLGECEHYFFCWSCATESFPLLLLVVGLVAARFSNFVREDNKIADRDIRTDRERREKLVTAKLIHDGCISPRRSAQLRATRLIAESISGTCTDLNSRATRLRDRECTIRTSNNIFWKLHRMFLQYAYLQYADREYKLDYRDNFELLNWHLRVFQIN